MAFPMYLDDDSGSRALLDALRKDGVDVIRSTDVGMRGRADPDHLTFAADSGRVLYSANRADFAALHRKRLESGDGHAGIILLADQRIALGAQIRRIGELQRALGSEEMKDWLEWVHAATDIR